MKEITIDKTLREKCNICLGCIEYKTKVTHDNKELWDYIETEVVPKIKSEYMLETLTEVLK